MCVCASIRPGRTVQPERSMTWVVSGVVRDTQAVTLSMRLPRTTIAWSRRGAVDEPSIRVPARMTVRASGSFAVCPKTGVARKKRASASSRIK